MKKTPEEIKAALPSMSLSGIAEVVKQDWQKVYFGAVPYLNALSTMDNIRQDFGLDSGQSIVIYFLGNAQTWRGPVAREVKAELNRRVKALK